jgi:hypothetical protein
VAERGRSRLSARASNRASARAMALVQRQQWRQTNICCGSFLCCGIEGVFFFFFFFFLIWLYYGARTQTNKYKVSFASFFYETLEWNFVSPNGVIDRALGFLSRCSGRRRSSSS